MRMSSFCLASLALMGGIALTACGGTRVTRNDPNATQDLSGLWNAEDSRLVADEMIKDSLSRPWVDTFKAEHGRNPSVQIGRVIVRANGDVIDTEIFTNDLRRAFVNSGVVDVVANSHERQELRANQQDQEERATEETRSKAFAEIGADFLLQGTIKVQDDRLGRQVQKFYSVDLILSNAQTTKQVWIGNKKIAKIVDTAKFR